MNEEADNLTRRELLTRAAIAAAATIAAQLPSNSEAAAAATQPSAPIDLYWLEGVPLAGGGTTWGVPWPKATVAAGSAFVVQDAAHHPVPSQSWPLAFWADGSVKWSAHALSLATPASETYQLIAGRAGPANAPATPTVTVQDATDLLTIDTGAAKWLLKKSGEHLIDRVEVGGRDVLRNGRLVALLQDGPALEADGTVHRDSFASRVDRVTAEQTGPVRAVVKIEGSHLQSGGKREILPFVVRLYFYAGSPQARMVHSFIYDLDDQHDFLAGLGMRFDVPMRDAAYDRHVRFVCDGEGGGAGVWAEAVQGITGLRRDPGKAVRDAQIAGHALPPLNEWATTVSGRLAYIPQWGDYSLRQLSADGWDLRKRTKAGYGWIRSAADRRASGVGYLGGAAGGGMAFGLRDFWQRYPTQLDIRNAHTDSAQVTIWLWSPDATPMDLRFYHDGMGLDTFAKQREGLEITYEDYEPGFGNPNGIARTSELLLWALPSTPSHEALADFAQAVRQPPQLVTTAAVYQNAGIFGNLWSPVDRSTPAHIAIENRLDFLIDFYLAEVDRRSWYGFWDHGDVMHTYDADRHCWRYDVGGYGWDNSELSPDLWIWLSFLRTGRADIFRFGQTMTRHTGEVDVYHSGRFKGLGSRHNVQHWGDSSKQLRISTVVYRRFLYYLTADERVGDLMHELIDCDTTFLNLDPNRKIRVGVYAPQPHALSVGFGTDWGSIAIALFTDWERTGNPVSAAKLRESMRTLPLIPHGFFAGSALYDPATGGFVSNPNVTVDLSHLSAVFGLPEIIAELLQSFPDPKFESAWLDYCQYYNATPQERQQALGFRAKSDGLTVAHSRLTAIAAAKRKIPALATRAWTEFAGPTAVDGTDAAPGGTPPHTVHLQGPAVYRQVEESPSVSTNAAAQWGLAAIENLALIGKELPEH
jgi:hypothetical protein